MPDVPGAADELTRELGGVVAASYLTPRTGRGAVDVGPLQVNYFSAVFPVTATGPEGTAGAFVKIPKCDLRRTGGDLLTFTPDDRRMAEDEFHSLETLAAEWQAPNLRVAFVRPLGFIAEANAVVTERAVAADACEVFRRWDLRRRLGSAEAAESLADALGRIGAALRRFHDRFARPGVVDREALAAKLSRYASAIAGKSGGGAFWRRVIHQIGQLERGSVEAPVVPTLKGFDVRNVLIDGHGAIFLLDPGRMKTSCPEADLARFVMTYRILHWGSPWHLLRLTPDPRAEARFLGGYYGPDARVGNLLALQMVKEVLKHWHTARESLRMKRWPAPVARAVRTVYVDPFYRRQLETELARAGAA